MLPIRRNEVLIEFGPPTPSEPLQLHHLTPEEFQVAARHAAERDINASRWTCPMGREFIRCGGSASTFEALLFEPGSMTGDDPDRSAGMLLE